MRRGILLLTLVGALLLAFSGVVLAQQTTPDKKIPDQYIVVLNDNVSDSGQVANQMAQRHGLEVGHTYRYALKGFSARIPAQRLSAVRADNRVLFISEDREVQTVHHRPNHGSGGEDSSEPVSTTQKLPTGVDRIEGDANTNSTKAGDGQGAVNVGVAILDTGIDTSHPDLNVAGGKNCSTGRTYNDGNGHGTHVAGTVAAKDDNQGVVGVAPGASLYAVRVLDNSGSGTWSSVICGVDWVSANAAGKGIKVANMSLGGSGSDSPSDSNCNNTNDDALHKAICNSVVKKGVTYVVAAGNSNKNFQTAVPAAYNEVLTVTAVADFDGNPGGAGAATCRSDVDDTAADFSNFTTVGSSDESHTIAAPGVCVESTWKGGGYNTISGTSMASPHVAGTAALYLSKNSATPAQTITKLRDDAKAQPGSYGFVEDAHKVTAAGTRYYGYLEYAGGY